MTDADEIVLEALLYDPSIIGDSIDVAVDLLREPEAADRGFPRRGTRKTRGRMPAVDDRDPTGGPLAGLLQALQTRER
jgi:molybdopterin-guanine dinucleotide biosynthesis protein A